MAQAMAGGRSGRCAGVILGLALALAGPAAAADPAASLEPEQIRLVQRALQDRGYDVAPTGKWDGATRTALSSFQSSNHLSATGTIDAATSQALGVDPSAVTPVAGRRRPIGPGGPTDPAMNCATNNTVDCSPGP